MNGHRQRGMAIISALLIVTVVAVIAAGLIARQSAFIRALESEQLRIRPAGCCAAAWNGAASCCSRTAAATR